MTDADQPIRVLLVEDHRMVAEGIADGLRSAGGIDVVAIARTCQAAVELAEGTDPHVVLMDYNLPDGNGADTAGRVRAVAPGAKVVMVTASVGDEVLVAAIEAGCAGFITKEQPVRDVVAAVRAVHAGRILVSPATLARLVPRIRASREPERGRLTQRELEVLRLLSEGRASLEMADMLGLSRHTIRNHIQNVLTKLGAHSKLEAVAKAARNGLITLPHP